MSVEEFDLWRAYDSFVQPIGDQRLARQAALIACVLANVNRGKHDPWDLDDFDLFRERMPLTREAEEEQFRRTWADAGLVRVKESTNGH